MTHFNTVCVQQGAYIMSCHWYTFFSFLSCQSQSLFQSWSDYWDWWRHVNNDVTRGATCGQMTFLQPRKRHLVNVEVISTISLLFLLALANHVIINVTDCHFSTLAFIRGECAHCTLSMIFCASNCIVITCGHGCIWEATSLWFVNLRFEPKHRSFAFFTHMFSPYCKF